MCSLFGVELGQTRSVGDDSTSSRSRRTAVKQPEDEPFFTGLLLNMDTPAQCAGMAVAWHYCFYLKWSSTSLSQEANLAVYRRIDDGTTYVQVGNSVRVQIHDEYSPGLFICETFNLEETFEVLEGDILGACLTSDSANDVCALDIIASSNDHQIYHKTGTQLCTDVNSVDVSSPDTFIRNGFTLHLHLEIGKHKY